MTDTFRKEYKPLSHQQKTRISQIKDKASDLFDAIDWAIETDPRMIELAKTKLEECVMWAVKAIT